ncbi:MAG: 16S rRNA (guanine(527)-N(7))-methyltransferase RsmG [Bdellovibrionaceae bacterium]|nr:16S rRNA (guanine(527)-N(7))-methyltransferase RsmG [Pseudobdellovibrionaceae bacterium]
MSRLKEWFPDLSSSGVFGQLLQFRGLLDRYNQKLNLVSDRSLQQAAQIHFADSILGSRLIVERGGVQGSIYDFGSGNGFPGIVMGILYPQLQVRLVDVDVRKCEFLKVVVSTLDLKNVSVINQNVTELGPQSVPFAVSRGFANLSRSLLAARKIFSLGGKYFHFKSEEWVREVSEIPTALCPFWTPELLGEYQIPGHTGKMFIVKTIRSQRLE